MDILSKIKQVIDDMELELKELREEHDRCDANNPHEQLNILGKISGITKSQNRIIKLYETFKKENSND